MKILVVDDDLVLSDVIAFTLRRSGYETVMADNGISALQMWKATSPSIVILDWQMPMMDGIEVCREIRKTSNIPIILLTVRDTNEDILEGLNAGADDYIKKPFSASELIARIKAVSRRMRDEKPERQLATADLSLNPERRLLERVGKEPVRLTVLEYRLMEVLMLNRGHVLPVEKLISHIWEAGGDRAMLKQLVYRLRRKAELDPMSTSYIEVIPGIGYALMTPSLKPA